MALIYQGFNGPFIGKLGTAVGYMWKGKACVRSYRKEIAYPNTLGQQRERDWFVGMVRFASKAASALKLGFGRCAAEHRMTEGNYFVRCNKQHFHTVDGRMEVDYEQLKLSSGPAVDVYFKSPRFEEGETVVVDFEKNALPLHASGSDQVYVYVYAPSHESGILSAPVERRSKTMRMRLPEQWAGTEVHLYGFVVDRDGRPSESTYIGVGRVNHYEERGRYIPLNKGWKDFVEIATEVNADVEEVTVQHADSMVSGVDIFADMDKHSPPE